MAGKPPLLLRTESEEIIFAIRTKMCIDEDLEDDELTEPAILVHGPLRMIPCKENEFERMPFEESIKSALRDLKYTSVLKIQRYCWRTVLRCDNIIVIADKGTGKTIGYAPCVCNFVLSPHPYMPEGKGPMVIILCPSVKTVEKVYTLIKNIMVNNTHIKIVKLVHVYNDVMYELVGGVDILITIPILLIRMVDNNFIDLHRVCHVVFDDATELYSCDEEINWILHILQEELKSRTLYMPIQLIVFSQTWAKPIEELAFSLRLPPLICISNYMEAAIYGGAEVNIYFPDSLTINRKVISLIKDEHNWRKTLIIYNDSVNPKKLLQYLEVFGILFLHRPETNYELVLSHKRCWFNATRGYYFVLVCSDKVLKTGPPIHDAEVIVQYSLPETWAELNFRFSGFINKYSTPLKERPSVELPCVMSIMVDNKTSNLLPKLINYAERTGAKFPDEVLERNKEITLANEMHKVKSHRPLCPLLLSRGSCLNSMSCQLRHFLNRKEDVAYLLPKYGLVKFKLVSAESPGHYYVRLIEWTDLNGWKLNMDIKRVVQNMIAEADKVPPLSVDIGSSYLLRIDDTFQRCKVLNIVKKDGFESIFVHGFDTGLNYKVSSNQLYMLNKKLSGMPHQAVLIYIANIKPIDRQVTWPDPCLDIIIDEFEKAGCREPNFYCTSRILLQLGDVLLVDDVKMIEKKDDGTLVKRLSVCDTLEKMECVEKHPEHLENLYRQCEKYAIPIEDYSLPVEEDNYSLPVEEENYSFPVEEENNSLPVEEENCSLPVEEENHSLPVEEDNYSVPVEKKNSSSHVEDENYSLPVEEENYSLPVEEENYRLPVEEENYRLPVEEENYSLPVEEENYRSSDEELNYSSSTDDDSDNSEVLFLLERLRNL